MKRTGKALGLLALAVVVFLATAGPPEEARASVQGAGSGWSFYAWRLPSIVLPTSKKVPVQKADIGLFDAHLHVEGVRTVDNPGIDDGGIVALGWSLVGIRVATPDPKRNYSWKAYSELTGAVLEAKVTCGKVGAVAGRAAGFAELQIFGDLTWRCSRTVAARDLVGGKWALSLPPTYSPPSGGEMIAYKHCEDKQPLYGTDRNQGADHHCQVRYRARLAGEIMAACQTGHDWRSVKCHVRMDANVTVRLLGFTAVPVAEGERDPGPYLQAELKVVRGETTPGPEHIEEPEEQPDAPGGEEHDADDFRLEDW